jgi:hypothetical protein
MIVVKGSECVLREHIAADRRHFEKNDTWERDIDDVGMSFPEEFVVAHDPTGEYLRPCDFYIARFRPTPVPVDGAYEERESQTLAERFYGERSRISKGSLELPDGEWQRVGLIDEIGYRRRGDRRGRYQHTYAESVTLYECKGRVRAWRLRLPVSCVADERGFVSP